MVSCFLSRRGKQATAIDKRQDGFDGRAFHEGVTLLQMDATGLQFNDETFDVVFSYDAFEHFDSPEGVLREAIRVTRNRGYIYLEFGPLYYSPYGQHAYRSITVPYCQFLFLRDVISDFLNRQRLSPIDFSHVNGWSLAQYRELWGRYSSVLRRIKYHEIPELSHLHLIRSYPSCFRSTSEFFENFIISGIRVLFQKTDHSFHDSGK
jgi:ubiquinone/menaquinone biosynthesis C-methylase UbiE